MPITSAGIQPAPGRLERVPETRVLNKVNRVPKLGKAEKQRGILSKLGQLFSTKDKKSVSIPKPSAPNGAPQKSQLDATTRLNNLMTYIGKVEKGDRSPKQNEAELLLREIGRLQKELGNNSRGHDSASIEACRDILFPYSSPSRAMSESVFTVVGKEGGSAARSK